MESVAPKFLPGGMTALSPSEGVSMFKRETLILSAILATCIPVIFFVGNLVGLTDLWPGYFTVLIFFIARCTDKKELLSVFAGGLTGLGTSWLMGQIVGVLAPGTGLLPAITIALAITVFAYAALRDVSETLFNDYGFMFFLTAGLFPEQKTLTWMLSLLVVGGIFSFMMFTAIRLFLKPPSDAA